MSDSAPPPPPPENPGGNPPPYGSAPPPPPANPYGSPAGGYGRAMAGPRPGEVLERFLARLIDFIIVGIVGFIITLVLQAAIGGFAGSAISAVISAVIYLGYFSFMESSNGQTVGKMALKLHVVGPDGTSKPTMEEAVKRNIWTGLGILGIIPILGSIVGGLLELVAMIMIAVGISGDPNRRQAWHDKFANNTMVIKNG